MLVTFASGDASTIESKIQKAPPADGCFRLCLRIAFPAPLTEIRVRNEVMVMRYLSTRPKTANLVPRVYAHSIHISNVLQHQYILMDHMPGTRLDQA